MKHEFALALAGAPPSVAVNFSGRWTNELESSMDLEVQGSAVSGQYTSVVSDSGGSITGQLVGYTNGRLISFVVNWPSASTTSWVGHLVREGDDDVIETLWQMAIALPKPGDPTELWESVLAGADRFHR